MSLKPWREVIVPHADVLSGTFQQSEFAADITAVRTGKAGAEYGDAVAFFQRTFITEGMRLLLTQVAQRLSGKAGEPVIQLQTAFGGGKTHTMLAVYHLATRQCAISEMTGLPDLVDRAGLMDVPKAKVAVLDGTTHSPGQPWKHGTQSIRTLWGELAWQLGGSDAFAMVAESDAVGTSPGKDLLAQLLQNHAPCVILVDELVVYMRQFPEGKRLSGGSYESNLSFIQALTEAVKLVPNAVLLASLPESDNQAGGERGLMALRGLEEVFHRVQALWKAVGREEAFEIVRRRLFEPTCDEKARDAVCRAFMETYIAEGSRMPSETQEARYGERLLRAYPIHPEVFDRLYEDWTAIPGFQRTRGILKLMAKVIYRLWKDDNRDALILPGSLPLYDSAGCRTELLYHLGPGWDPVIDRDIDGDHAETVTLESREPRFGGLNAARKVARTLFLGTAPSSVALKPGARGLDRARVLLGCLEPGQTASTYTDALQRLADRLHYLNSSGDKSQDTTRFWFNTIANLRREMEDRKKRFDDKNEVRGKLATVLNKLTSGAHFFDGVHVFTPHSDVPDDGALRLIFLPPENQFAREETRVAFDAVIDYTRNNGSKPRYRGNRLLFIAPDGPSLNRLRDCIRTALAWASIVDDITARRLNIDSLQEEQTKKELKTAEEVVPKAARECYKWLLCPVQHAPTDPKIAVEFFPVNTAGASFGAEIERVCKESELVISAWSPVHLRARLRELYWKEDKPSVPAMTFWEDTLRYLYLPRLRTKQVLEQAIVAGAGSRDFFGTAYGFQEGTYDGFRLGDSRVQLDDTLLLIEPSAAVTYAARLEKSTPAPTTATGDTESSVKEERLNPTPPVAPPTTDSTAPPQPQAKAKHFHGSASIPAATAKVKLVQIAEEIIALLNSDPAANVSVTLEINGEFPGGVSEQIKRAVSENATSLGFRNKEWE